MHLPVSSFMFVNRDKITHPEDVLCIQQRTDCLDLLVGDGVSGFHSPTVPNRMFETGGGVFTGGQMVGRVLQHAFHAFDNEGLSDMLLKANDIMRDYATYYGVPLDRPDDLPAIDVAAARIMDDEVEIIQMGDCFAIWETVDGKTFATKNQTWKVEALLQPLRARYKGGEFFVHAEKEFRQYRLDYKNKKVEGGEATLNGQPGVEEVWFSKEIPRNSLRRLLLITDGLALSRLLFDSAELASCTLELYQRGGWEALVEGLGGLNSITEGTGIAVEFV